MKSARDGLGRQLFWERGWNMAPLKTNKLGTITEIDNCVCVWRDSFSPNEKLL